MNTNEATGVAFYWLSDTFDGVLDAGELYEHTLTFMREAYDPTRVGSYWGYTPELAVESQVSEYAREVLGWSDPREGA